MFRLSNKGPVCYLESESLKSCSFLTHAFLTRQCGASEGAFASLNFSVSVGDTEKNVAHNWEILAAAFETPLSHFFMINQVHGDRVLIADDLGQRSSSDHPIPCDAVLTSKRGLAVGIKTADCIPILLVDRVARVIGAVHAGWRGTSLQISAKTIQMMKERFHSKPSDILAAAGPAIGSCCYQVDEQVYASFLKVDDLCATAFQECKETGKWMLDLALVNRMQLMQSGVPEENISSAGICTSCRTDFFFSHRAEKEGTGRQLSFIALN